MLDIDYIIERPLVAGSLIYRYRSRALLPQIKAVLRHIAEQEEMSFCESDRSEFLTCLKGGTFFSSFYWCDWTAVAPSSSLRAKTDTILESLLAVADQRFALFVPAGSAITKRPLWTEVEKACFYLEEPWVTSATLPQALRSLQATNGLARETNWLDQPEFVASFDKFPGRKKRTLLDLRYAFEDRIASCTDPVARVYLPDVYQELHEEPLKTKVTSPLRRLRGVLQQGRGWDWLELIRTFDERHSVRGWTARDIVVELYRITREVLAKPVLSGTTIGGSGTGGVGMPLMSDIALWAALLLASEDRLRAIMTSDQEGYRRRPDGLVTALDQLGRQFLDRVRKPVGSDPLCGVWSAIDATMIRMVAEVDSPLAPSRTELVQSLSLRLRRSAIEDVPWLDRLQVRVRRAVRLTKATTAKRKRLQKKAEQRKQDDDEQAKRDQHERERIEEAHRLTSGDKQDGRRLKRDAEDVEEEEEEDDDIDKEGAAPVPDEVTEFDPTQILVDETIVTLLGEARVSLKLRERVSTGQHDTSIILHGPEGVGKSSLARIYARAALCDRPTDEGEACVKRKNRKECDDCEECKSFETSRPNGYFEVDTCKQGDRKTARKLVRQLAVGDFAARRVIIIKNADRYSPQIFDVLLQTLEEPTFPTTFVLLACDLRTVRLAGQSRCIDLRVRPLTADATRKHMSALLASRGVHCETQVLDVLVAGSGGLPELIQADVEAVVALPVASLEAVRMVFGYEWVDDMAAYWLSVLADDQGVSATLVLPEADNPLEGQRRVQAFLLRLWPAAGQVCSTTGGALEAALLHRDAMFVNLKQLLQQRADVQNLRVEVLWHTLARHWLSNDHADVEGFRIAAQASRRIIMNDVH